MSLLDVQDLTETLGAVAATGREGSLGKPHQQEKADRSGTETPELGPPPSALYQELSKHPAVRRPYGGERGKRWKDTKGQTPREGHS